MSIFCVQEYNYLNLLCVKKNSGWGKTSNPLLNLPLTSPHRHPLKSLLFIVH